jgi:hypothetical protein
MSQESTTITLDEEIDLKLRLTEYRNPPQRLVLSMLGENMLKDMDLVKSIGQAMSDIINDHTQVQIRELILERKAEEAAKLIYEELQKQGKI